MGIFRKVFGLEPAYGRYTDQRDGRSYRTIEIGNQVWMAENLIAESFLNGDPIKHISGNDKWARQSTGAWCYYDNDEKNGEVYGKLYNWYAVQDKRGLAPEGWHIPTEQEFRELFDRLGGDAIAGGRMKTPGVEYWERPNVGSRRESGFSALPGGERLPLGGFYAKGAESSFWTSSKQARSYPDVSSYTEEQRYQCTGTPKFDQAYYVSLYHETESTGFSREEKRAGCYVRCLKTHER